MNEVSFAAFSNSVRAGQNWSSRKLGEEEIAIAATSVRSGSARRPDELEQNFAEDIDFAERQDIEQQHERMMRMFAFDRPLSDLIPEPTFAGCGIIDSCRGDLIVATTLQEIKAGDRLFRSVDIRQLITYATLNQISRQYEIDHVGLFNPRVGISMTIALDELCFEICGRKAAELLGDIAAVISSGEISR